MSCFQSGILAAIEKFTLYSYLVFPFFRIV